MERCRMYPICKGKRRVCINNYFQGVFLRQVIRVRWFLFVLNAKVGGGWQVLHVLDILESSLHLLLHLLVLLLGPQQVV